MDTQAQPREVTLAFHTSGNVHRAWKFNSFNHPAKRLRTRVCLSTRAE